MKLEVTIRLLIAVSIGTALLASPMPAFADGDPFDSIKANTGDTSAKVQVEKQEPPQFGVRRSNRGTANVNRDPFSERASAPTSTHIDVLQPFCLGGYDNDGTGYMDCFEIERSQCTEPGSQYVIRARYERADPANTIQRVGTPFCSAPSEPVVNEPEIIEPDAPPMPVVTLEDFRNLDIQPSKIESDSGGFGLIRANTNFYATEEFQTLSTVMLEQQVAIQAIPVQWTFDYGDGTAPLVSSSPGGPQREFNQQTTTSHAYQDTGTFPVNVSTAYRGQFSVNGGPWIAIPGTASVPSAPVEADIWRSESKNVAEDCDANPDGWACGDPFIEG